MTDQLKRVEITVTSMDTVGSFEKSVVFPRAYHVQFDYAGDILYVRCHDRGEFFMRNLHRDLVRFESVSLLELSDPDDVRDSVRIELENEGKIRAIKKARAMMGVPLIEAKRYVDAMCAELGR